MDVAPSATYRGLTARGRFRTNCAACSSARTGRNRHIVATADANHDAVVDILDDEGTIDMDEREDSWRAGGWSGTSAGQAGRDSDALSRSDDIASDGTTGSRLSAGSTAGGDLGVTGSAATTDFGGADVPRTAGSASLGASSATGASDLATGSDDTLSRGSASESGAFASAA